MKGEKKMDKFTVEELLIEAETLEECGEYLHMALLGYTPEELRAEAASRSKTCN